MDSSLDIEFGFLSLNEENSHDLVRKTHSKAKKMFKLWGKPEYTEAEIIKGIQAGSGTIFEYLYRRFKNQVIRHVVDHGGSREDGKDILQATLLSIFNYDYSNYRFNDQFEPFFVVFYKNAWKNRVRTRSRRPSLVSIDDMDDFDIEDNDFMQSLDETGNLAEKRARMEQITRGFEKLSPNCQNILKLFFEDGLSPQEVSDYLGISYGATKKRKHDCMNRLKKMIDKDSK